MSQHHSLENRLDSAIDAALTENRIVGTVVLVAKDGAVAYRRSAGQLDREAGTPMREDAIFRLASVSKPMVTTAAMRLIERGELSLDQPITRWLPDFRPALPDGSRPDITLHHLLTHTSGLSYRFFEPADSTYHSLNVSDGMDQPGLSLAENLARLAQAPLIARPGIEWHYSLGIDVAGAVMEAATGKSLAQVVRDEVTGPLGLTDTGFAVTDRTRLAAAYGDINGGPTRMEGTVAVPFWDVKVLFSPDRIFDAASYPSGGAGMAGTAADMLAFLEAIRRGGGPVLKPETVKTMLSNRIGAVPATAEPGWGFGYGWAVLNDPAPSGTPMAKGTVRWGGAYGHSWFVDPENRISVVALTNTAFEGMAGRFAIDIRNAVYG